MRVKIGMFYLVWSPDLGYLHKPYRPVSKVCDDLCNPVIQFSIPWVGIFEVFVLKRQYHRDGLWVVSSASGSADGMGTLGAYTHGKDDTFVMAEVPATAAEIEVVMGDDAPWHTIWTDAHILTKSPTFERFLDAKSGSTDSVVLTRNEASIYLGRNL